MVSSDTTGTGGVTEGFEVYEFHWVEGLAGLSELAGEWSALATETGADIYVTPSWVLTWWKHFGGKRKLMCLVARDQGNKLVGLIPFMIDKVWIGPLCIRVARLAASDPHTVIFNLSVRSPVLEPLMERAFHDLLGAKPEADLISFTPATEQGRILGAVQGFSVRSSEGVRTDDALGFLVRDQIIGAHTVFLLPDSFEKYLAALSKKRRSQFRRDLRRLQSDYGLETSLCHPSGPEFAQFVEFHNHQWQETGHGGHFTDWYGSAEFYADLAENLRERKSAWIDQQVGHGGRIAAQFSLVVGETCHWRLPARALDGALNQLSIGKVGLILMIERLIRTGVTRIEAGVGTYDYKLAYGGQAVPVHRLIVLPDTAQHRARLKILLIFAQGLQIGYYRLWFGRLAVRLRKRIPLAHKPLWRSWIRTRV
jgi:CelD/BcsL family acetyltransferase involved in cellulose biosynthesis